MAFKARLLTATRMIVTTALALLLLAFLFVQAQQRLLRHRAERVLADFQSIQLHKSTWADAQTLMTRWGAWGHYDGACTSTDCDYTVTISDFASTAAGHIHSDLGWSFLRLANGPWNLLGGSGARISLRFLVQDGVIWRDDVGLMLQVFPRPLTEPNYSSYFLALAAKSNDSLHQRYDAVHKRDVGPWILGGDAQLAQHPNYKAGRPDGCKICMSAEVTFTPAISAEELKNVTSYDLSCVTRYSPCRTLPDVLPVALSWHLYDDEPAAPQPPTPLPQPCAIPLFVVARDASAVLRVEVLSTEASRIKVYGNLQEVHTSQVRLIQSMKGTMPLAVGTIFSVHSYEGDVQESETAEPLASGRTYILIPDKRDRPPIINPDFCGVFPDSADAQARVAKGIAQNDNLRHHDNYGGSW